MISLSVLGMPVQKGTFFLESDTSTIVAGAALYQQQHQHDEWVLIDTILNVYQNSGKIQYKRMGAVWFSDQHIQVQTFTISHAFWGCGR